MTLAAVPTPPTLLEAALALEAAGCSVVPPRIDGSKAPSGAWKHYQTRRATRDEIRQWYHPPGRYDGVGVVTGAVSGNLEMLELEGRAHLSGMFDDLTALAQAAGHANLWHRVTTGYRELTPSAGIHLLYRVTGTVAGNTKLATRPGPNNTVEVLIETRGEGGYVILAPSHGRTHPNGAAWHQLAGGPATIPTITPAERDALHQLCRALHQPGDTEWNAPDTNGSPSPLSSAHGSSAPSAASDGPNVADDYNNHTTWDQILTPVGWTFVHTDRNGVTYWCRPGKNQGVSATTGYNDGDNLFVFSSSTTFRQEKPYSRFAAYAHLNHGDNLSAAAKALYAQGYGARTTRAPGPFADLLKGVTPWNGSTESSAKSSDTNGNPPDQPTTPATASAPDAANTTAENANNGESPDLDAAYLNHELTIQRARRQARRILDQEEATAAFREPPSRLTLTHELALPDDPITYAITDVLPTGGNALLTAGFKTGKTTLIGDLARAYADYQPFLGKFDVPGNAGRIALFNYELDERQYRRWLRELDIHNTDRVAVLHLRGYRLQLTAPTIENWVVEWLKQREVTMWVVDPFARAFVGSGDENDNSQVGAFLDTLDVIKERAGVSELILPTHTGRTEMDEGTERARGATRLDDWADVRWILTKDKDDNRYFRATGRDVEVPESRLDYHHDTRTYRLAGGDRRTERLRTVAGVILKIVARVPGIGVKDLRDAVREDLGSVANDDYNAAHKWLVDNHRLRVESASSGPGKHHHIVQFDDIVTLGRGGEDDLD